MRLVIRVEGGVEELTTREGDERYEDRALSLFVVFVCSFFEAAHAARAGRSMGPEDCDRSGQHRETAKWFASGPTSGTGLPDP
jgi:hypothetical protein